MGRAFFSSLRSAPVVKIEPAPVNLVYEKWSLSNNFDPDSDEFWDDAQLEKFIDVDQPPTAAEPLEDPESSSSSSSDGSDMDHGSPVAGTPPFTGTVIWERVQSEPWTFVSPPRPPPRPLSPVDRSMSVTPPPPHESAADTTALSPSSSPPTTPRYFYPVVPSPAPAVTPRIYHWTGTLPMSPSPASSRGSSRSAGGPLTNSTARRSLARITPLVVRAHAQA